jgi:hypothetical protein
MLTASSEYVCALKLRRASRWRDDMGGNTMTTYIVLFSLTDAGIKRQRRRRSTPPRSLWQTWAAR